MDDFEWQLHLSVYGFHVQESIVEELRLLADSMSTHQALAKKIGISEAYLCDILQGRRNPRAEGVPIPEGYSGDRLQGGEMMSDNGGEDRQLNWNKIIGDVDAVQFSPRITTEPAGNHRTAERRKR